MRLRRDAGPSEEVTQTHAVDGSGAPVEGPQQTTIGWASGDQYILVGCDLPELGTETVALVTTINIGGIKGLWLLAQSHNTTRESMPSQ